MSIDRRTPRCKFRGEIEYHNSKAFVRSCMLNISTGGVFIETDTPLPIDAQCVLRIPMPGAQETLDVQGHVVWTKQSSNSFPAGMGVHFINLSAEQTSKIQSLMSAVQEPGCDLPAP